MKQLLNISNIDNVEFTGVSFIDDVVGIDEKRIFIDMKHFNRLDLKSEKVELAINQKSLSDYMEERNKTLLKQENYAEFDHMNNMLGMLEHDFFSIDKIKLFYRDENNLSGEYIIDTSDEDEAGMASETHDGELILTVKSID
ncbi:hypothetical protein [Salinicoccus albus]|uniref:hypothetical protein n=1 Tax=Salinicoccus albus TaxID=418756 RepID=UPI000370EF5F|nr:hypothetical protein [Salinicoccus albus]